MKLFILGGTGRVGSHIVSYALEDGHDVKMLVRTPEKVQQHHSNLTVLQGDALQKEDIARAMKGNEVVISALSTDGATTLSESMPFIIETMHQQGIQRIITIGTAGILQSRVSPDILRYQSSESKRKQVRAAKDHHQVYELLQQSKLDWTIVCPTYLPDGEKIGRYRVERDFLPEGGTSISVPDTAAFAYSQITSHQYLQMRVGIAY